MKNKLIKQVFTFGFGQQHEGGYYVIWGETKEECRKEMFERFGNKWSMQYDNEEKAGVKRFNLRKIR